MSGNVKIETPLARVRGLGAARSGTGHFWQQRLTAVASVPLTIAFVVIVGLAAGAQSCGGGADPRLARSWPW